MSGNTGGCDADLSLTATFSAAFIYFAEALISVGNADSSVLS